MSTEDQRDEEARTAQTVGQLVKYSREVNQSDTVDEVGTYALEATFHVMEGHPAPAIVEVRGDDRLGWSAIRIRTSGSRVRSAST